MQKKLKAEKMSEVTKDMEILGLQYQISVVKQDIRSLMQIEKPAEAP